MDEKPPSCVTHIHSVRVEHDSIIQRQRDTGYLCSPIATRWFVGHCSPTLGVLRVLDSSIARDLDKVHQGHD